MNVDVVIDVVCPWCFVGKRHLDRAMAARPGLVQAVRYRPYQLNPNTPEDGVDRDAAYRAKFGDGPELDQMRAQLTRIGAEAGIAFDFTTPVRIANSLDAHRLIRWALSAGVQAAVADRLMSLYFEEARFIGDHALLADVAGDAGMDRALVADLLASDRDKAMIEEEAMAARQMGVTGVPYYVFNRQAGVSGAQAPEVLMQVMDRLAPQVAGEA
ncbi:DsbA family oxidoreductase [Yunchengibacter salinarum]|uniref:DsbA family oxidoreductase n=1 Tax=Yunchengibacter salinarum TaxID=3133399 RepID=UPI0035B6A610